ncbi:MAG: phosphoenolpyruvate carboxylase, partial [Gemmatimonadaceae bacterium]
MGRASSGNLILCKSVPSPTIEIRSRPLSNTPNESSDPRPNWAAPTPALGSVTTPGPTVRKEDVPLHEDVRWLAAALGRVILRLEGKEAFETIEGLRKACRARRHGDPSAPSIDQLLLQVEGLSLELSAVTARAFTLFFLLINTAEQVHRVRRSRAYRTVQNAEPQPASAEWAMHNLKRDGHTAQEVEQAILALDVRPVLTAHP